MRPIGNVIPISIIFVEIASLVYKSNNKLIY